MRAKDFFVPGDRVRVISGLLRGNYGTVQVAYSIRANVKFDADDLVRLIAAEKLELVDRRGNSLERFIDAG